MDSSPGFMHPHSRLFPLLTAGLLVGATACGNKVAEESAVQRGDVDFAEQRYDRALAEYQLAVRQGGNDAMTLARVAHTYAVKGRVDQAIDFYDQAVQKDSSVTGLAVADLMHLAHVSLDNGDTFAMASAVEGALKLRPGLGVGDLALPLARHYYRNGEFSRSLPFYLKAMATVPSDSTARIVFEVGRVYDQIGDCQHALIFFERFRKMVRPQSRGEVDWYIGTCAFNVAKDIRARTDVTQDDLDRALDLVNRTLEVGEPRNIQGQAWFEKGAILSDLGQCQQAMDAYNQVRFTDASQSLVDRAQNRFDEIRFGEGLTSLNGGKCR